MERSRMRMPCGRYLGSRADHDGTRRRGRAARGPDGGRQGLPPLAFLQVRRSGGLAPGQECRRPRLSAKRLLAGLDQCGRRRQARVQVEARARGQDVHDEAYDADWLALGRAVDGGEAHLRFVDDGDAARALDLERLVRPDEGGRVLVEPEADRERVVGERGDEAAEAVALAEVLVDDESIREAEARREPYAPGNRGRAVVAKGDHVLREDRGS